MLRKSARTCARFSPSKPSFESRVRTLFQPWAPRPRCRHGSANNMLGCPTLAAHLFLRLGWDTTNSNPSCFETAQIPPAD